MRRKPQPRPFVVNGHMGDPGLPGDEMSHDLRVEPLADDDVGPRPTSFTARRMPATSNRERTSRKRVQIP